MKRFLFVVCFVASAFVSNAAPCSMTLGATDTGWYSASGFHDPNNNNYFAGYSAGSATEFRDWFAFDLPTFTAPVVGATLRVFTFDTRFSGSATVELHHVSTSVATLTNGGSQLVNVFDDLADGPVYGASVVAEGQRNSFISIPLNSNAVAAISAAPGQRFAMGGRLASILAGNTNDHTLFGYSYGSIANVQLTLALGSTTVPVFLSQPPTNYFIPAGGQARVSVTACGGSPLGYRWFFNGVLLPLQTSATLAINNVATNHTGNYFVVVSNSFGAATSSVTRVFVEVRPPEIISLDYNPEVPVGAGDIYINAHIIGAPEPVIRWQFNGSDIPGQTNHVLYLPSAQFTNAGIYTVIASNAYGVISRNVTLSVVPFVIYGPYDTTVALNTDAYLSVTVSGSAPSTYQWRFNGTNIASVNAASLPLFNISAADAGVYDVVVSNSTGIRTSALAHITVAGVAPELAGPFGTGVEAVDSTLILRVLVSGSLPLHLQWYVNGGGTLASATNAQLLLESLTTNHSGFYYAVASNAFGVKTSGVFEVSVQYRSPSVLTPFGQVNAYVGDTRYVPGIALGGPRPGVRWQFAGVDIPGATNMSLLLTNLSLEQAGVYTCVADNELGTNSADISIDIAPRRALDRWKWRNPAPQANDLGHIVFGNGRYVAGGEGGALVASTNGVDWTGMSLGKDYLITALSFGNGVFMAIVQDEVTGYPFLCTSSDGLTWTPRAIPSLGFFSNITFANGQFHAYGSELVDDTPQHATSSDGVMWSHSAAPGLEPTPESVAYGNGVYVAVNSYYLFVSVDGAQFTFRNLPNSGFRRVTFGNGQFVAVGYYGIIWTSSDGVHWRQRNSGTLAGLDGVAVGNGRFVAAGDNGTLLTSTDAATWTAASPVTTMHLKDVLFDGTQFVVCGDGGVLLTSPDGTTWTDRRGGKTEDLYGVVYTNGQFVAVGYKGTILTSSNGVNWTTRASPNSRDLHAITYAAEHFIAVGDGGTVLASSNAINWASRATPTTNYLQRITYAVDRYVAVGSPATIISSPDGIDWDLHQITLPPGAELNGIAFGQGTFLAVGGYVASDGEPHSLFLISTTGTSWSDVSATYGDLSAVLRSIAFGQTNFLAVGDQGEMLYLNNTKALLHSVAPPLTNLRQVRFELGRFVIVGDDGMIASSSFPGNWYEHASISSEHLNDIAFGLNKFVIVGDAGTILQSDDAQPVFSVPRVAGGTLHLDLRGGLEPQYRVQSSDNLSSWTNLAVFTNNGGAASFADNTNSRPRFYRAITP